MAIDIELVWNVYDYNYNRDLRIFNVFRHSSFMSAVDKLLKMDIPKEEFSELLRRQAQYYYWAKSEWECIITDTQPHIGLRELDRLLDDCYRKRTKDDKPCRISHVNLSDAEKFDVYDQLMLNWDEFVEYVWGFRNPKKSRSKKKTDNYAAK